MHYRWERRGLLIPPATGQPWARSHAALPVPVPTDGRGVEVYYSPRDEQGRAHVARCRVEAETAGDRLILAGEEAEPILSPGALGSFDDSGVTVSCVVQADGSTYLYYTGWTRGVTVPFYFYVGLAVRPAGERRFARVSQAPVLERDSVDPFLTASPWVLVEGGTWRMWYVSCVGWRLVDGEPQHRYHIRYAESDDGIAWRRDGHVSIDFLDDDEYALSRPCVVRDHDRYRMWFAARGERYLLGYAESDDGIAWARADECAGLDPSPAGWDSEMLAYPAILDHAGRRYLLYNGNGFGRTGTGYAVGVAPS